MILIAGPCQHENLDHSLDLAAEASRICSRYNIDYYFKASFDKANRSNIKGIRGKGIDNTLRDFIEIKKELKGIKILTDVHETWQVDLIEEKYSDAIDVYQIPAFLCRQTDLIKAACATDKIVNIKKGQFLAPWDVAGIISKTEGAKEVWITERGTSFGYNNLVVDFTGLQYMLAEYNCPIIYDVTHSVQRPGGNGTSSGGNREYVPGLARAASAMGIQHFFLEIHNDPDNAPSDGPNMLNIKDLDKVVKDIVKYKYE